MPEPSLRSEPRGAGVSCLSEKRKPESDFPFAVSVGDVYEGPLDLLLDLIRKQDIDIYDIPIARITAQYLAYVEKLRELDVNVAADFIYMAAVLIHIKSKMLLPRDPARFRSVEDDPRTELVNRLIEHEKFKSAAQMLMQKQQIEDAVLSNPCDQGIHGRRGHRAGNGRRRHRSGKTSSRLWTRPHPSHDSGGRRDVSQSDR